MDTSTFTLFAYLPAEIRIKIWALNLPEPRLVSLRYTSSRSDPSNPSTRKALRGCTSTTSIPTNLHVNAEARTHALHHFHLSFNLHHCASKIWFDFDNDVLYFPSKEGWLGSWNHFVNAFAMITPAQLGKLKRLAVHESLFRVMKGSSSSPNIEATCVKEFWEYVSRKCANVEEVVVLVESSAAGAAKEEEVKARIRGVLGCVLGSKDGVWVGSPHERLVETLGIWLRFMEEESGWTLPRWDVLPFPGTVVEAGSSAWPAGMLAKRRRAFDGRTSPQKVLDSIVVPHSTKAVREDQEFSMGGQLPHWHYLRRN